MAFKAIKFTSGLMLPIVGGEQILIDSNGVLTSLENGALALSINGEILNSNIDGTELTDLDGNQWKFTVENGFLRVAINDKSSLMDASNSVCFMSYSENNGEFNISFACKRSVPSYSTSGNYMYGSFVNNVSGSYTFEDRIASTGGRSDRNKTLSNFITTSGKFVNCVAWTTRQTEAPVDLAYLLFYAQSSVTKWSNAVTLTKSITDYGDETDPYNPGGESGTGGGTGDFDGTGDDIDFPSLPTLSAVDTGFITLFNPTAGQLKSLANYMWSNPLFDLDAWKKIFADPMDAILGLSIVPVAVPNGGQSAVTVGNISTGVSMNKAAAQYVSVDCGTLNINEYWGAYLDYDPYTKAEIYLPYIGTHPLAVDDIMNKPVHVKYHIDILSGACCAFVKCGGSVLYSFVGQCAASIPITGNDWTNVINGALSIAASIGTMIATGGASAPLAASAIASTAVNSMKPNVEKSGSMGGMGGMLGVQTPYIILTRPRQALPNSQNKFMGYPSFITRKLSAVSGYTEIESIHLDGIPATEQEISEIESLLKGGVIL